MVGIMASPGILLPKVGVIHLPDCDQVFCFCEQIRFPPDPAWVPGRTLLLIATGLKPFDLGEGVAFRGIAMPPTPYKGSFPDWKECSLTTPDIRVTSVSIFLDELATEISAHEILWAEPLLSMREASLLVDARKSLISKTMLRHALEQARTLVKTNPLEGLRLAQMSQGLSHGRMTVRCPNAREMLQTPNLESEVGCLIQATELRVENSSFPEKMDEELAGELFAKLFKLLCPKKTR